MRPIQWLSPGLLSILAAALLGCAPDVNVAKSPPASPASPANAPPPAAGTPSDSVAPSVPTIPDEPSIAGLSVDGAVEHAESFGLACERDLPPAGVHPPVDLRNARCDAEVADANAVLQVVIAYWPDGGVLSVEAISQPVDPQAEPGVDPEFRDEWLRWFATIRYQGSDTALTEAWLLEHTTDECGQGCHLSLGDGAWFHAAGLYNADQVSLAVAG